VNEEALAPPPQKNKYDGFSEAIGFCTEVEQKLSPAEKH